MGKKQTAPTILISERMTLASLVGAGDMTSPSMRAETVAAVQYMADLCCRIELGMRTVQRETRSANDGTIHPETAIPFPCGISQLQSLFCIGDERLALQDRTRIFNRPQALWKHVKNHLDTIFAWSEVAVHKNFHVTSSQHSHEPCAEGSRDSTAESMNDYY